MYTWYTYYADLLRDNYDGAWLFYEWAADDFDAARVYWNGGNDHLALDKCITGCYRLASSVYYIIGRFTEVSPWYLLPKLHTLSWEYSMDEPPAADVSMDAILSAMITASLDEYTEFIGLVDAYRVGLWNKPFNSEYYAALARGFAL